MNEPKYIRTIFGLINILALTMYKKDQQHRIAIIKIAYKTTKAKAVINTT
jgi:hypothetical protein